ncbi:alpha/beta hydrolase [Clostridium sp. MSJ-4]|uniref:Alpha/beta hydrolase n=1 Tax=Clostridium simiarum TaxID=2841506 RepID=A0ABS6F276_9CLOT|nr:MULTISPECIES: alpha/beta hydrolase [Clostridium]MBU5591995.1 alpha/beta hydrolase [Clostridium simiarum]
MVKGLAAIATILLFLVTVYFIVEYYFSQIVTRKLKDEDELFQNQVDKGLIDKDFYESLPKEEIFLRSREGLKLRGIYIEANKDSNKTMVFVHGITVGLTCSIKYTEMFLKRGWNVLIYDQRRHARSEGQYSTYGYYEKEDLDLFINWLVDRKGKNEIIGLHGESMGAATVIQYDSINKYAKFIISDCGFSNLNELLRGKIKDDYGVFLYPVLKLSDLRAKRKAKFKFEWIKPIEVVRKSSIPMMFIHGDRDKFVPWNMSVQMYKSKENGIRRLYLAKGAKHAQAIEVDKKRYEKEVMEFVDEVLNSIN